MIGPHKPETRSTPFVQVDIGLFANQVGITTSDTLDFGQSIHDLSLAINIGVEKSENVLGQIKIHDFEKFGSSNLELLMRFRYDKRHGGGRKWPGWIVSVHSTSETKTKHPSA